MKDVQVQSFVDIVKDTNGGCFPVVTQFTRFEGWMTYSWSRPDLGYKPGTKSEAIPEARTLAFHWECPVLSPWSNTLFYYCWECGKFVFKQECDRDEFGHLFVDEDFDAGHKGFCGNECLVNYIGDDNDIPVNEPYSY